MGKSILAVVLGVLVAFACVFGINQIGVAMFPPPEGLDFEDKTAVAAYFNELPTAAFLIAVFAHFAGAFLGAFVGSKLAPRSNVRHGYIVGIAFLVTSVLNLFMLPHPGWFWAASIIAILAGAFLGAVAGAVKKG